MEYTLNIEIPDSPARSIIIKDNNKITIGNSPGMIVDIESEYVEKHHCTFRLRNGVLSLHNFARGNHGTLIGSQQLQYGKIYIVDQEDKIQIKDSKILINISPSEEPAKQPEPKKEPVEDSKPATQNPFDFINKKATSAPPTNAEEDGDKKDTNKQFPYLGQDSEQSSDEETKEIPIKPKKGLDDFTSKVSKNLSSLADAKTTKANEDLADKTSISTLDDIELSNPEINNEGIEIQELLEVHKVKEEKKESKIDLDIESHNTLEVNIEQEEESSEELVLNDPDDIALFGEAEGINSFAEEYKTKKNKEENNYPSITSLLEKAHLLSEEKTKKLKPKTKKSTDDIFIQTQTNSPGSIIRTVAFIANLSLIYGIYVFVLPIFSFDAQVNQFLNEGVTHINNLLAKVPNMKIPHTEKYLPYIETYIIQTNALKYYLLYVCFDILSHIIFGTSFPLFVLSVKSDDYFINSKIKAFFRSMIGAITLPFLIFDSPCIIGKRTFKEVLTSTRLHYGNQVIKFLSIVLLLPVLVVIGPLCPMAKNLSLIDGLSKENHPIPNVPTNKNTQYLTATSLHFSFKTKTKVPKNISFIPMLDQSNQKTSVIIYDKNSQQLASMERENSKTIIWRELLKDAPIGNPLFNSSFPNLYQSIKTSEKSPPAVIALQREKELKKLVKTSLTMSYANLHDVIREYGPFINTFVNTRDNFLKALQMESTHPNINFITAKNKTFLQIFPQNNNQTFYLYPLLAETSTPLKISSNGINSQKALNNLGYFIKKTHWYSKRATNENGTELKEVNAFTIIDLFSAQPKNKIKIPKISNFFEKLVNDAKLSEQKRYIEFSLRSLKRAIKASRKKMKEDNKHSDYFRVLNTALTRVLQKQITQ